MDDDLRVASSGFVNGHKFIAEEFSVSPGHNLVNRLRLHDAGENQSCSYTPQLLCDVNPVGSVLTPTQPSVPRESLEDFDFSDVVLKYISQILMEEDMEEKVCMFRESAALQAAEKSFYEVIGEKYPPSPDRGAVSGSVSFSQSSVCSSVESTSTIAREGFADSPMSSFHLSPVLSDSESVFQFKKGAEAANKFLLDESALLNVKSSSLSLKELEAEDGSRGKKNPHPEDVEERNQKQSAVSSESDVSSEMFDMVLLSSGAGEAALRESMQNVVQQNGLQSNGGKARGKKQGRKKRDVVDMRTLLSLCAQAVAADDRRSANDLLMQIRKHSSDMGDGMQRMAHYFANGLEARLAGSGTQIYRAFMSKPTSAADVLKAYHLFLAACPFKKISNFFSNKTIMNLAEKATKIHIVDFGILYGFQWPCLIERLSSRACGPPKLRITGIDLPNPGFRPAERVEETGRRLDNYAKTFGVPFEFNAIAQKWDTIKLEDLKLDSDEVLIVNCMYRLRNLLDETVVVDSPRDIVLNLIRKMNPDVFVLGIVNGAYSAPFFITRFREALFHYSTIFDMLETNVPRDIPERMLIERDLFGFEAMNVIACEGSERIERPETYKQLQVRILRAGFTQLPLNAEIVDTAKQRVRSYNHKDFVIDQDSQWLLQGWKGRIIYGLSTWRPD